MPDDLRYIVRRFNWRWAGACFVRAPGEHRLAWFDTPAAAAADRWRRERDARGRVNPFECGPALHYLTTMPEPVFLDWLRDADIDPPDGTGFARWAAWWKTASLSEEHAARVWDGLNRVRFHDVIARRPSEVAYAVVRVMWYWNDEPWDNCDSESGGGEPLKVFRSRERAEQEYQRLDAELRAAADEAGELRFPPAWRDNDRWLDRNTRDIARVEVADAPLYEVVEIDLPDMGGGPCREG